MKSGIIHIGKIKTEDILKSNRRVSRELEIEIMGKWTAKHKVHKSVRDYTRKLKHKKRIY